MEVNILETILYRLGQKENIYFQITILEYVNDYERCLWEIQLQRVDLEYAVPRGEYPPLILRPTEKDFATHKETEDFTNETHPREKLVLLWQYLVQEYWEVSHILSRIDQLLNQVSTYLNVPLLYKTMNLELPPSLSPKDRAILLSNHQKTRTVGLSARTSKVASSFSLNHMIELVNLTLEEQSKKK